jgi:hypothetical protein
MEFTRLLTRSPKLHDTTGEAEGRGLRAKRRNPKALLVLVASDVYVALGCMTQPPVHDTTPKLYLDGVFADFRWFVKGSAGSGFLPQAKSLENPDTFFGLLLIGTQL